MPRCKMQRADTLTHNTGRRRFTLNTTRNRPHDDWHRSGHRDLLSLHGQRTQTHRTSHTLPTHRHALTNHHSTRLHTFKTHDFKRTPCSQIHMAARHTPLETNTHTHTRIHASQTHTHASQTHTAAQHMPLTNMHTRTSTAPAPLPVPNPPT